MTSLSSQRLLRTYTGVILKTYTGVILKTYTGVIPMIYTGVILKTYTGVIPMIYTGVIPNLIGNLVHWAPDLSRVTQGGQFFKGDGRVFWALIS